jgi:hypothetical protein
VLTLSFVVRSGTGKTHVTRAAIELLRRRHGAKHVFVTSPTGIAALHVGGTTLHSFAGLGVSGGSKESQCQSVRSQDKASRRWREARALVIDEVSQLDRALLELLDFVASRLRSAVQSKLPLSGLQVLLVGDFAQLPPVSGGYCFSSPVWTRLLEAGRGSVVVLRTSFRMGGGADEADAALARCLDELRIGRLSSTSTAWLRRWSLRRAPGGALEVCATNREVKEANRAALAQLLGDTIEFTAQDSAGLDPEVADALTRLPRTLALKLGAPVMVVANVDPAAGLVNGARGRVLRVDELSGWPVVLIDGREHIVGRCRHEVALNNEVQGFRCQVPLKLAWCISIHKLQGLEFAPGTPLLVRLDKVFEYGQVYTAMSRVRRAEELFVTGFDPALVRANPAVTRFLAETDQRDREDDTARPEASDAEEESPCWQREPSRDALDEGRVNDTPVRPEVSAEVSSEAPREASRNWPPDAPSETSQQPNSQHRHQEQRGSCAPQPASQDSVDIFARRKPRARRARASSVTAPGGTRRVRLGGEQRFAEAIPATASPEYAWTTTPDDWSAPKQASTAVAAAEASGASLDLALATIVPQSPVSAAIPETP